MSKIFVFVLFMHLAYFQTVSLLKQKDTILLQKSTWKEQNKLP